MLIRRNSVQRLFDGYYFDHKRAIAVPDSIRVNPSKKSALEAAKEKAMAQ